ncbi:dimethyladenosine transferase 2, mitochondrial [Cydia amplana]|uniref:dimethyladenosine transferase 2, mitochondrial n=1 Tax=Cydia amplana TaxID=1869771 RepID=UPI002FE59CA8
MIQSVRYTPSCVINFTFRNSVRLRHKLNKAKEEKPPPKVAQDVMNYIENTPEYAGIRNQIPKFLLRKYKAPESMYLINEGTAKEIVQAVKKNLIIHSPIVEVNPGLGILSKELLQCQKTHLYMYESSSHFSQYLKDLQSNYPGRVNYKIADFFGMWKLAFQDKMDQGNRIQELLGDLATDDPDRVVTIVGSMPGLSFVKHLINTIVFHNTTSHLGRPDLFITMPGHHYEFLTDNEIQNRKHMAVPTLFQLLFDFKILANVPKVHFLPWTYPTTNKRVTLMDEHRLYLVNISQKRELPVPPEYLPLLWYFFKPHMFSKSTRVIPMLEQWIPGCGVWLITGQDPPDTDRRLAPGAGDAPLPHMTIFTEFGDLNLKQKITVFKKLISWPEFEQCPFRVSMENNLPKFVTAVEDDEKTSIGSPIDDIESSDTENET